MKLNDVIDIDGKLYQIIYVGNDDSFKAEPIGEVVAKGFTRPQDNGDAVEKLYNFCNRQSCCCECCLEKYLDCFFEKYNSEQLDEACRIIEEYE